MSRNRIKLDRLLAGLVDPGDVAADVADIELTGLALDTRHLRPGDGFVALAGERGHGLDFLDLAVAAGAGVVLHDGNRRVPAACALPAVQVPALASHLDQLGRRMWADPAADLDLLAVTGTNGKTSVAWLLAQALDGAMIGTLGSGRPGEHRAGTHTTPDVLSVYRTLAQLREQGIVTVVIEASSHALEQQRLVGLTWTSAIFTTLGHDHLDYHADLTAYGEAKARLFTEFSSQRQLINFDDDFGRQLAQRLSGKASLIGYSLAGEDRARASARLTSSTPDGLAAEIELDGETIEVRCRLLGRINLWNVLIVATELGARGMSGKEISRRIAELEPVPGRMQPIFDAVGRLAVIDYAHTPDALENALVSTRELTARALWCVFGCGGDRDRDKRPRMGRVAESLADRVVLTDDNPRGEDGAAIIRAIQAGMQRPERSVVMRDRAAAIRHAIARTGGGDVVLIAGKGHETEQIIGDRRMELDDARIARQALGVAA